VYSGVSRGNTPESGWIHLKVGIQRVLFLLEKLNGKTNAKNQRPLKEFMFSPNPFKTTTFKDI